MGNLFVINNVEYKIVKNPYTAGPMIARVDGQSICNRIEICRIFLREHGWTEDMFAKKITNDLERIINKEINGTFIPNEIGISNRNRIVRPNSDGNNTVKITKIKRRDDVPNPSLDQVEYWLQEWDTKEDYVVQEDTLDKLFHRTFKSNNELQNILIKCTVLNHFYSTNIFKIYPVAKHIFSLDIDNRLKTGDPTLVDDIAKVTIKGKEKTFYSFASKYCSHHNDLEYPIYDSYVHKVLMYFKAIDGFYDFKESELKNYGEFKNVLLHFRSFYKLDKYNLKELDKYLWQLGMKYFPKKY